MKLTFLGKDSTPNDSPTLDPGETWRDVREPRADVDTLAQRGLAYEHLDQLALEYLYGIR